MDVLLVVENQLLHIVAMFCITMLDYFAVSRQSLNNQCTLSNSLRATIVTGAKKGIQHEHHDIDQVW